jgi:glycosyltransferase involved in cell wall biosynthesis
MSEKYRLAPLSVAQKFSFDSIYSDDNTFGCHKPFIDTNILESPVFTKFIEMVQGVNVIGFGNYRTGLGHNMRMVIDSIRKLKIPHTLQSLELDIEDIQFFENEQENYFSTNIVMCNPDFGLVKTKIREKLKNKKNIGFWVWELESIPNEWIEESQFYDEIWTVSEFSQKSMQKCLPGKPVKLIKIPSVVNNIIEKKLAKDKLNLSNKFIVTFMFDGNSDVSRKNPHSVINSFLSSLSKFNDCILIIKSQNLQKDDLIHLKSICRKENILLINKPWSSDEMSTLWSATDVYISLHRSEGSGLSIMESLYHGIPTITTNWSGNLDFCKKEFCELVDFDFVEIDKKSFFYKSSSNQRWADAKISDASEKLLNIYNNYEYYLNRTKLAKKFIDDEYNLVNLSEFILTNIEPNIQNQ